MKNVVFVFHVYDEPKEEVDGCIVDLRKLYPLSAVICIYDGSVRQFHTGITEIVGDHIKLPGRYCSFTKRYLEAALRETNCDYIIKIDPDTKIHSRIKNLPAADYPTIFCRMTINQLPHGGAIGYTRLMANLLVDSGWLEDPSLFRRHSGHPYQDPMLKDLIREKKLHVQVRRDFGWTEHENSDTVFSHGGFRGHYIADKNQPKIL